MSELAETLYTQVQDLQKRTTGLENAVDDTHETVTEIDRRLAEQHELLLALAEEYDLDREDILADSKPGDASDPEILRPPILRNRGCSTFIVVRTV